MIYLKYIWNLATIILSPLIYLLTFIINIYHLCFNYKITKLNTSLELQLCQNYNPMGGYMAGRTQYANVWTRDSFFALMAPIPEKEIRIKKLVDRLKLTINCDNLIPFTFNQVYYLPAILFGKKIYRDKVLTSYKDEKFNQLVMDSNSQYIIMCYQAFKINQDENWLNSHYETLIKALAWYDNHLKDDLIHEKPFGCWEDSLLLYGCIPYTNVLYLKALECINLINNKLKKPTLDLYTVKYEKILKLVENNPDTVSVALMAIWTIDPRITGIMQKMINTYPDEMIPNRWPCYPSEKAMLTLRVIGQGEYHRNWRWSWVGCLWVVALVNRGFYKEAKHVFARYEKAYQKYGTIHEVYDPKTESPIRVAFYSSEGSFSEGMGLFLFAQKAIQSVDSEIV